MIIKVDSIDLLIDDDANVEIHRLRYDKSNGYIKIGKKYLHRVLMDAKDGEIIDHINGNKVDNRMSNLRKVNKSLNNYNKQIDNKLGRGIYYDKYGKRYRACISHNNKTEKLGSFKNINDAKIKYNERAKEIYGNAAILHKIEDGEYVIL